MVGVKMERLPSPRVNTGLFGCLVKFMPSVLVATPRLNTRFATVAREPEYHNTNRLFSYATQGAKRCLSSKAPEWPRDMAGVSLSRRQSWGPNRLDHVFCMD